MTRSGDDETERPAPKVLYIPGRPVDKVLEELRQDRVKQGFGEMGSRMAAKISKLTGWAPSSLPSPKWAAWPGVTPRS